jgi:hypothetical protein
MSGVGNPITQMDIFKRNERNVCKFRKILILMGVLGLTLLMLPTVWSDTRFEMDPGKVAAAEARMWQAYYTNDHIALRQELTNLLRSQFGISVSEANDISRSLASAAMKFESAGSNYKLTVLPDLVRAYSILNNKRGISFDPKEAAGAELDWWVARRTPGRDSVEEVGRLIAHLYAVLFGETGKNQQAFERAGLLRAQAAHIRDEGGASCNWSEVEQHLHESYQALQDGLKITSKNYSAQVTLSWEPNKENNIAGYKIYYGNSSGNYGYNVDVGNRTSYTITGLESGKTYYFVTTAYNNKNSESGYSAEVSHKATVGITSPSLPQNPAEEYALQEVEKGELQQIKVSHQNLEVGWLPQGVDLTRHTNGPFTVKVRVEGIDEQRYPTIFPRITYYIGTGSSYGYFDMIHEGDNVWRFDIPDPSWNRYRSNSLHYHVKVFDEEGNVISESRWKTELIDSFIQ